MKDVHEASPEQIARINALEGNNARHIQDISARQVDSN
jgi:carbonic anhydrase